MKKPRRLIQNMEPRMKRFIAALIGALAFTAAISHAADPLPSWNEGAAKKSITAVREKN